MLSKDPNLRPTTRALEMSIFAFSFCLFVLPEAKYVAILNTELRAALVLA